MPKARKVAKTFNKAGRTPRAGVNRSECGRIVLAERLPAETPEEIKATVLAYRRKGGIGEAHLEDRRTESPFGRLRVTGVLSAIQYRAGQRFARIMSEYHVMQGIPSPWPAAVDIEGGPSGASGDRFDAELATSPEQAKDIGDSIAELKRDYADMMGVLLDLERSAGYRGTIQLVRNVVLFRHDIERDRQAVGNLRAGLNVLARAWKMTPA